MKIKYRLIVDMHWNYPSPSNSHHQDYSRNPYKPSFVTVTGWGGRPKIYILQMRFFFVVGGETRMNSFST